MNNTDERASNIVWFGSADGQTPDCQYCHESFTLSIVFTIHSGDGKAGILFRTGKASTVYAEGPSYLVRVRGSDDNIQIGTLENGKWDKTSIEWHDNIIFETVHNLTVVATANLYDVYYEL